MSKEYVLKLDLQQGDFVSFRRVLYSITGESFKRGTLGMITDIKKLSHCPPHRRFGFLYSITMLCDDNLIYFSEYEFSFDQAFSVISRLDQVRETA